MTGTDRERLERRVLVLAPTGKDSVLTQSVLCEAGIHGAICPDLQHLANEVEAGAGAALVAEEAIMEGRSRFLGELVARQPPWSDFPMIILALHGADSVTVTESLANLGNVTFLERPLRVATFLSTMQTALRARLRQYQIRDYLLEREQATQALKEEARRKDEFLAMLAHELRNPLAPIRNTLETFRFKKPESPLLERALETMDRQVTHLTRLVDDLLDVSRITRGLVVLQKKPLDIATVVGPAVEMVRGVIEARGHNLMVSLPAPAVHVEADPTRLTQVLFNLLNNAAKYTDPGGQIWLSVGREDGEAVVRVRDTGVGIGPDFLPRIFDLFIQGERTLDRSEGGLGLGLTLVRRLVEMHGGTVLASSAGHGQGSEFIIRIPVLPAGAAEPSRAPVAPPQTAGRPARVLVVDDNVDVAESVAKLLECFGHQVKTAHSGARAVELALDYRPEAVLLDIGLPGMNGYEVARRLRAEPELKGVLLVALSGYGREEDRLQSQEAGFDEHLLKPLGCLALQPLLARLTLAKLEEVTPPRQR